MATISDNFNRADADPLGSSSEGWSWAETNGDTDIVSNEARGQATGGHNYCRAEIDLASDDHYAQLLMPDFGSFGVAPCVRCHATNLDFYMFFNDGSTSRLFRVVTGGLTEIGASGTVAGAGDTIKIQADGNIVTCYINGILRITVDDGGAITGNLRTGMDVGNGGRADDFVAADISTAVRFLLTRF